MRLSPNISCAKLALMLSTVLNQIKLLQTLGIFPTKVRCEHCDKELVKCDIKTQRVVFTCENCRKDFPIRKNTVLENCKLSFRRWLMLAFSFVKPNWTYNDGKGLSK